MLFGKKKPDSKTLLLLDVEQGSVGSTLVRLCPGEPPKLFGETRVALRVLPTRDSSALLREVRSGVRAALSHAAQVASRLRNAPAGHADSLRDIGTLSRAAVFLGAPWGTPSLSSGSPSFLAPMRDVIECTMEEMLGPLPHALYTAAGGLSTGAYRILPHDTYLMVLVGGEITELILFEDGAAAGYATAPTGRHLLARTLRAHGVGGEELSSLMKLSQSAPLSEPLGFATEQWASSLADAASPLVGPKPPLRVWVLAHGAAQAHSEWFAKALTQSDEFNRLFPQGGELRALTQSHVMRHIAAHAQAPDLAMSLQALYSDGLL